MVKRLPRSKHLSNSRDASLHLQPEKVSGSRPRKRWPAARPRSASLSLFALRFERQAGSRHFPRRTTSPTPSRGSLPSQSPTQRLCPRPCAHALGGKRSGENGYGPRQTSGRDRDRGDHAVMVLAAFTGCYSLNGQQHAFAGDAPCSARNSWLSPGVNPIPDGRATYCGQGSIGDRALA
jgi:hypothetical protein